MKKNEFFFLFCVVTSFVVATILIYYRTMVMYDYGIVVSEEATDEVVE